MRKMVYIKYLHKLMKFEIQIVQDKRESLAKR